MLARFVFGCKKKEIRRAGVEYGRKKSVFHILVNMHTGKPAFTAVSGKFVDD